MKLFYDIESFKHDLIIVFKDEHKNNVKVMHNNFDGLREIVQNNTLIGYNNYFYDDKIISLILKGNVNPTNLKAFSNSIIKNNFKVKTDEIDSLDCFQELSVSRPGLKKIQANKGENIHETPISFDLDRPLKEDELKEVIFYCESDVNSTIEVYFDRLDYFEARSNINKMLQNAYKYNTTTLTGMLFENPNTLLPPFSYFIDELKAPEEVKNFWRINGKSILNGGKPEQKKYTLSRFGNEIDFAFGGLHGTNNNYTKYDKTYKTKLLHVDVASMYPNIINNLGIMGVHKEKYAQMIKDRVALKKADPKKADTLKLILNKVYGVLNNKYNSLYNPKATLYVCLFGQSALYCLGEQISDLCTIIQFNTDGIYIYIEENDVDELNRRLMKWENEFNLQLDSDEYKEIYQRDVNNYIVVDKNDNFEITSENENEEEDECETFSVKGSLKKFNATRIYENNSLAIVDLAVINKLVHNVDILDTIVDNQDNLLLFQQIVQAGNTFLGTFDADKNKYQKINRLFAVKNGKTFFKVKRLDENKLQEKLISLKKKKAGYKTDKSKGYHKTVEMIEKIEHHLKTGEDFFQWNMFPNSSESSQIENGDLNDVSVELDINHYYSLAMSTYKKFTKNL